MIDKGIPYSAPWRAPCLAALHTFFQDGTIQLRLLRVKQRSIIATLTVLLWHQATTGIYICFRAVSLMQIVAESEVQGHGCGVTNADTASKAGAHAGSAHVLRGWRPDGRRRRHGWCRAAGGQRGGRCAYVGPRPGLRAERRDGTALCATMLLLLCRSSVQEARLDNL